MTRTNKPIRSRPCLAISSRYAMHNSRSKSLCRIFRMLLLLKYRYSVVLGIPLGIYVSWRYEQSMSVPITMHFCSKWSMQNTCIVQTAINNHIDISSFILTHRAHTFPTHSTIQLKRIICKINRLSMGRYFSLISWYLIIIVKRRKAFAKELMKRYLIKFLLSIGHVWK